MTPWVYRKPLKGSVMMNCYWRVFIDNKEYLVLAIGLMVFICGCSIAVLRDRNNDNEIALKEDTGMTGIDLISVFGETSGALSLSGLENDPQSLGSTDSFRDRVALITVKPIDQEETVVKVPSQREYDDHDRVISEMWTGYVPIDIGGKIVPGEVEVVLYG